MARKYKEYVQDMLTYHQELFDAFRLIHDKYALDPEKYQQEFNDKGEEVLVVMRKYENMLCNNSEGSRYGKFSSNLADKFREEVRTYFSKIDFIGMK